MEALMTDTSELFEELARAGVPGPTITEAFAALRAEGFIQKILGSPTIGEQLRTRFAAIDHAIKQAGAATARSSMTVFAEPVAFVAPDDTIREYLQQCIARGGELTFRDRDGVIHPIAAVI